jgi:hypothetical protein
VRAEVAAERFVVGEERTQRAAGCSANSRRRVITA